AVFADEEPSFMRETAASCGASFIQSLARGDAIKLLSNSKEKVNYLIASPTWVPVVRVRGEADLARAKRLAAPLLLLDSYDAKAGGGTGRMFRWSLVRRTRPTSPFLLAGGLTPANVRRAIRAARPYGVDVCSGVEREPGVKDHAQVRRFIRAAKTA
ncbi:MAG: phosphoribosylanthranilate isomerase, partial [bacterium]